MAKLNIIQTGPFFFQCNIPADLWTDEILDQITNHCKKVTGILVGKIRLGSGYFRPGMKEIFFLVGEVR